MNKVFLIAAVLGFVMLIGAANAQTFEQKSIIVTPEPGGTTPPQAQSVHVWLDKRNADGSVATYKIGSPITIGLRSDKNAYVYLLNVRANGEIVQIFPNAYSTNNYVRAGGTRYFGNGQYRFKVGGPVGTDHVVAVASSKKLTDAELSRVKSQYSSNPGTGYISLRSIIIEPTTPTPEVWSTAKTSFYIRY